MGCNSSTEMGSPRGIQSHPNRRAMKLSAPQPNQQNFQQNHIQSYSDEIVVKPVKVDKEVLMRYINLEQEINRWEKKNVPKALHTARVELENIKGVIQALTEKHQQCVLNTKKEKADVDEMQNPSVKAFFQDQVQYDAKFSKEQEEYLAALNEEEVAKKELDGSINMKQRLEAELKGLEQSSNTVHDLYRQQDELLAGIFNGAYGSDLEDKLERELDAMLDRKQRISVAKFKWQGARVLLQHACTQLAFSVKRWQELAAVPPQQMNQRYTMATEVRNNLIAANQNIVSAQRYLANIQFPYCKEDEMATLNRATNNIYIDMMTKDRHSHAYQCFVVTHKRAAALLQWFDHVINNTINRDMQEVTAMVQQKQNMLRSERLRLIKLRIQEEQGENVDIDIDNEMDIGDENESDGELIALAQEPDTVSNSGDVPSAQSSSVGPTPLPDNELAPPPSETDIFGNIDGLKKQHEKEMEEFQKAQEMNKARMDQGLQDKLADRRTRRKRQQQLQNEQ